MFETETLRYATLATVSRCGMIWFSESVLSTTGIMQRYLMEMKTRLPRGERGAVKEQLDVQEQCVNTIQPHFNTNGVVVEMIAWALSNEAKHGTVVVVVVVQWFL